MLLAQTSPEEFPTNNTANKKRFHPKKHRPKTRSYAKIYKRNTKGTLYGNPCALEVTRSMGFEYVPLTRGKGKSPMGRLLNNLWVKTKLVFTRTPFWKLILNKKLDNCRSRSGDGVG
jgi:hypothetical protein